MKIRYVIISDPDTGDLGKQSGVSGSFDSFIKMVFRRVNYVPFGVIKDDKIDVEVFKSIQKQIVFGISGIRPVNVVIGIVPDSSILSRFLHRIQ